MKLLRYIKKIGTLSIIGLLSCSFFNSCIEEDIDDNCFNNSTVSQSELFINLKVALPSTTGSRSSTTTDGDSSDGTQLGVYNENVVGDFKLLFCVPKESNTGFDKLFELSTDALRTENPIDFNTSSAYTKLVSFKITVEQLQQLQEKPEVWVFFIGNNNNANGLGTFSDPGDPLKSYNDNIYGSDLWNWSKRFGSDSENKLGFKLPVINHEEFKIDFTGLYASDLNILSQGYDSNNALQYADVLNKVEKLLENKFSNKILELERINARFDYGESGGVDHVFPIVNSDTECPIFVKMTALTPINVTKFAYMFRHTAPGTDEGATYTAGKGFEEKLFGDERGAGLGYTWVLGSDAEYKTVMAANWNTSTSDTYNGSNKNYEGHYSNYPPRKADGTLGHTEYEATNITDLMNDNNYNYSVSESGKTRKYYAWRYIPENTLPTVASMIRGLSTGIEFKVQLGYYEQSEKDGETVKTLVPLTTTNVNSFAQKLGKDTDGKDIENYQYKMTVEDDNKLTFFIGDESLEINPSYDDINPSSVGYYYMNYYYFIRHNDNEDENSTGPMEFGVVRNNIYRLSVAGFNGLPTPYNPEDPDEPPTGFSIAVNLKVLAWAKHDIVVTF